MEFRSILRLFIGLCILLAGCSSGAGAPNSPAGDEPEKLSTTPPEQGGISLTEEPTSAPAVQEDEFLFDPARLNTTLPGDIDDIVEEAWFYGKGGGEEKQGETNPCEGISKPTIVTEWFDVEQLERAWVLTCGWRPNTDVTMTVQDPNGATIPAEAFRFYEKWNPEFGSLYWSFLTTILDLTGTYHVEFSNSSQSLEFEFNVDPISKPGAILLRRENEIRAYNFEPHETVRLFQYEQGFRTLEFVGWQQFTADEDGNLVIKFPEAKKFFQPLALVGETTGEFHLSEHFAEPILKTEVVLSDTPLCPGAPVSQVGVGSVARVTFTDGSPTRVRKQPTTSSEIIGRLSEGTRFVIVDGHKCSDGYTWWRIELPTGTSGWMAEGKGGSYFLEPMDFAQQTCSALDNRLSIGEPARVSKVNGGNMRLRSDPGFSQSVLERVPEGATVFVLAGPTCMDGSNWWYVRTNKGAEGWMTESQNGVYLLEPEQ